MRQLTALSALLVLIGSSAFAVQTVQKDFGSSGSWKAAEIKNHDLWQTDALFLQRRARGATKARPRMPSARLPGSGNSASTAAALDLRELGSRQAQLSAPKLVVTKRCRLPTAVSWAASNFTTPRTPFAQE